MDEALPNINPFGDLMIRSQPILFVDPADESEMLSRIVEEDSGNVSHDSMASRANYKDFNSSDEGVLGGKDKQIKKEESALELGLPWLNHFEWRLRPDW